MTDKVKLPRNVAEAIDRIRRMDNWDLRITECMYDEQRSLSDEMKCVKTYFFYSNTNSMNILKALINGYEVEQTPEDNLRQRYTELMEQSEHPDIPSTEKIALYNYTAGIKFALTSLSIEIEGITK